MCVQVVRALPTMSFFAQLQSKVCLILDAHTRHIWKPFATSLIHNSKTKHNQTKLNSTKQNKTKQNKTKQHNRNILKPFPTFCIQKKTKQNKTEQNKTKQNSTTAILSNPF